MSTFKIFTLPVRWFMALLLLSSVAGCLGSSSGGTAAPVAPTIKSAVPLNAATGVSLNSSINATFSKAMAPLTITSATFTSTTFTLMQGTTPVSGSVKFLGTTAVFYPTVSLAASTTYTATVSTGVKDVAGDAMAVAKVWSFTTGLAADTTAPTVNSTVPATAATGVALNTSANVTFNKAMDPLTFTSTTFTLMQGTASIAGSISFSGTTALFRPSSNLAHNTVYTATVTTGVKDLSSNAMAGNYTWSFTTGTAASAGPAPVNLGTAGNYTILAETGITATLTAGTVITGNIAVSPIDSTAITGFSLALDGAGSPPGCFSTTTPSTLVTGRVYAADYNSGACPTPANLTTAVGDMMIAFSDAAGRAIPDHTELGAGNISGLTLAPGLYKWGTGVLVNTDVTLSGAPNDVWIFQISGDLTVANGAHMLLAGGALPKNIFWQVDGGTGVAIGTTAHIEGVILASKAITLNTGATGNGRLLARTAVTLDSNAVTQPAP